MWLNHHFLLPTVIPVKIVGENEWKIGIKSLRDGSILNIKYSSGSMALITENIGLAAEVIQSIATYLNIDKLEVGLSSYCFEHLKFNFVRSIFNQLLTLFDNIYAKIIANFSVFRAIPNSF